MKKCCPRVRVKCARPAPTKLSQSWYELKSPTSKPIKHTATALVTHPARCSVYVGGKVLVSNVPFGSNRIDKAVSRGLNSLQKRGCSPSDPVIPAVKDVKSIRISQAPSEVVDRLRSRAKR